MKERCLCLSMRKPIPLVYSFYSSTDAAKLLGMKWTKILVLIKRKKIHADVQGKALLISREEILRFAQDHKIFLRELGRNAII